jgi:hypothetical protein
VTERLSNHHELNLLSVGPGIAYYFMPSNVFISGAAMLSELDVNANDDTIWETSTGIALAVTIGKEWWVSDNWALGVAGELVVAVLPPEDHGYTWGAGAVNVAFTATYN